MKQFILQKNKTKNIIIALDGMLDLQRTAKHINSLLPVDLKEVVAHPLVYLKEAFRFAIDRMKFDHQNISYLTMKHLMKVFENMGFFPTDSQLSEAYSYACFDQKFGKTFKIQKKGEKQNLNQTDPNIQEDGNFDEDAFIEWLQNMATKLRREKTNQGIIFPRLRNNSVNTNKLTKNKSEVRSQSENRTGGKDNDLQDLIKIFDQMDELRQNHGLVPIDLKPDESDQEYDEYDMTIRNIPYDPDLYDLNSNINKLRNQAEQEIKKFIEKTRDNPKLRNKLEQGVKKFQLERITANEKIGKLGAIQAQKRIIQSKQNQEKKIQDDIDFIFLHQDDLLRNQRLYYLMNKTDKPKMNFERQVKNRKWKQRIDYLMNNKLT